MLTKFAKAFTVAELLIVVTVIVILATITIITYNGVNARGRDAVRRSDLDNIAEALGNYWSDKGNVIETGSGCGYNGNGYGWLTYDGGSGYTKSIMTCLKESGYLGKTIQDPSGGNGTSLPGAGYAYMKYHCGTGDSEKAYVYAKLETVPQSSTATDGTCDATLDTNFGMNYYVEVR